MHECERVLGDRLVSEADRAKFGEFRSATTRKFFGDLGMVSAAPSAAHYVQAAGGCERGTGLVDEGLPCFSERGAPGSSSLQEAIDAAPLVFNSFMARDANDMPVYACAPSVDALKRALEEKLAEYNENNPGGWLGVTGAKGLLTPCAAAAAPPHAGSCHPLPITPSRCCCAIPPPSCCSHELGAVPAGHGACVTHHTHPGPAERPCNVGGRGRLRCDTLHRVLPLRSATPRGWAWGTASSCGVVHLHCVQPSLHGHTRRPACALPSSPAGKQSLARLAANICGYEVFQIAVSSTYGVNEFKTVRGAPAG